MSSYPFAALLHSAAPILLLSRVKVSPPPDGFQPMPLSASLHFPDCFDRSRYMFSKLSLAPSQSHQSPGSSLQWRGGARGSSLHLDWVARCVAAGLTSFTEKPRRSTNQPITTSSAGLEAAVSSAGSSSLFRLLFFSVCRPFFSLLLLRFFCFFLFFCRVFGFTKALYQSWR